MKTELFGTIATHYKLFDFMNDVAQNPNTDSKKLPESLKKFSNFLIDAHVGSCVQSRKSGVLSMDWELTHGENNKQVTDFINDIFSWLDMRKIINQILDAPLYGFQPLEIYWDYDGNYLAPMDVIGKPPWWFEFDKNRLCYFRNEADLNNRIMLPRNKFIVIQHNDTYTNPYGESVLAKCYMPLIFKRGGFELWSLFIQKYGMPYIWAKVMSGKQEDIDKVLTAIAALKQDGGISLPDSVELSILDSGSNSKSSDNYLQFIHFCNSEISKAILSQTLTTEQGSTGSYAMSQTHLQVRDDVVASDAKLVESAFNKLIEYIVELNFENVTNLPKFALFGELDADLNLAKRDQIIFSSGFVKPTKEYLKRHHNFKDDEIEMIEKTEMNDCCSNIAFNENDADNTDIKKIDNHTKEVIEKVSKMIMQGKSFKDIEKNIIKLLPEINNEQLEQYFSQAFIIAQAATIIDRK